MGFRIAWLNRLDRAAFAAAAGAVFEKSPWIAEAAWLRRPFAGAAELHAAMCQAVREATPAVQIELIRTHPDLAGRAALAGDLTKESAAEQAGAGLDRLTPVEMALFQKQNSAYREKFGFPFVICARLNQKQAILEGFARRLGNSREREIQIALEEIFKIADFRLRDLITE